MIQGLGIDIIEVSRIEKAIKRYGQRFLNKIFTPHEQSYCLRYNESARHFAGRFAAKEAIVKALGVGFRDGINWLDIEILNNSYGKPSPTLSQSLQEYCPEGQLKISISHCKEYASAVAILVLEPVQNFRNEF